MRLVTMSGAQAAAALCFILVAAGLGVAALEQKPDTAASKTKQVATDAQKKELSNLLDKLLKEKDAQAPPGRLEPAKRGDPDTDIEITERDNVPDGGKNDPDDIALDAQQRKIPGGLGKSDPDDGVDAGTEDDAGTALDTQQRDKIPVPGLGEEDSSVDTEQRALADGGDSPGAQEDALSLDERRVRTYYMGVTPRNRPFYELKSTTYINTYLKSLYYGKLREWRFYARTAGKVTLQVWRRVTSTRYKLVGQTSHTAHRAGLVKLPLSKYIFVMAGDVLGFRCDGKCIIPCSAYRAYYYRQYRILWRPNNWKPPYFRNRVVNGHVLYYSLQAVIERTVFGG